MHVATLKFKALISEYLSFFFASLRVPFCDCFIHSGLLSFGANRNFRSNLNNVKNPQTRLELFKNYR